MAMKVRYTTIAGEVMSENRNGLIRDYLPDSLGSTVGLLDNTQTITDTFEYWPYGEVRNRTGTNTTPLQFVGTQGYHTDSSSKIQVGARVLDSQKGRWMTKDPIGFDGGDSNLFRYVFNMPINYTDPNGMQVCNFSCFGYPGGPCALAKFLGDDNGDFGGVVCCDGFKILCVWKSPGPYPGMSRCVIEHENTHTGQVDCPSTGYVRPRWSHPGEGSRNECHAYIIGTACLIREKNKDCSNSKLTSDQKKNCRKAYMTRICADCKWMTERFKCPTLPQICSKCKKGGK